MNSKEYYLDGQKVFHYRLTVNAASPEEAKAKAIENDVECSDLLDVELSMSNCREIEK